MGFQVNRKQVTEAKSNGGVSPHLSQPFKGDTHETNKCVGAVYDENIAKTLNVKDPWNDDRAYKCVGESAKIDMDKKGQGTITS